MQNQNSIFYIYLAIQIGIALFPDEQGLGVVCAICVFQRLGVEGKGNRIYISTAGLLSIEFCRRLSASNGICHILCGSCSVCTGDSRNQFPAALIQADFLIIFCEEAVIRAGAVLGNCAGSRSNSNGGVHQLQRNEERTGCQPAVIIQLYIIRAGRCSLTKHNIEGKAREFIGIAEECRGFRCGRCPITSIMKSLVSFVCG